MTNLVSGLHSDEGVYQLQCLERSSEGELHMLHWWRDCYTAKHAEPKPCSMAMTMSQMLVICMVNISTNFTISRHLWKEQVSHWLSGMHSVPVLTLSIIFSQTGWVHHQMVVMDPSEQQPLGLVEIKCPAHAEKLSLFDLCTKKEHKSTFCLTFNPDMYELKRLTTQLLLSGSRAAPHHAKKLVWLCDMDTIIDCWQSQCWTNTLWRGFLEQQDISSTISVLHGTYASWAGPSSPYFWPRSERDGSVLEWRWPLPHISTNTVAYTH